MKSTTVVQRFEFRGTTVILVCRHDADASCEGLARIDYLLDVL